MRIDGLDVIVVGGATGGAAAALLLARAGARVRLLERVAEPRAVGAGIALAENGLAVLESLGLGPALSAVARDVGPARVVDPEGRTLFAPPEPRPRVLMVRRAALQDLLLDAVAGERHIDARFGATVTGAGPDGKVQVETVDGPAALKADLVIGADGVHSRIRAAADFGARVSRPGIAYLRALVEGVEAHGVEAWTAAGLFGSFPVDRGVYLYASAGTPACRDAVEARDLDALRAVWRRAWPQSAPLLDRVGRFEDLIVNRVVRVDCRRWHDGRIVLVGDAAHAMAPNLGQGGNSALVDAAVLLDALREAPTLGEALAAYEARRRPAVRRVARLAGRLGALAELTNPALRFMRDRVLMPLVARVSRGDTTATVMQERPDRLLAIGRSA